MKTILTILALAIPVVATAQGMNQQDMQKMMVQMQEMQACMESIDQSELKVLEKEAEAFEAEMKILCAQGKRDEAQEKAIAYGMEVMQAPAFVTMRRCTEKMQGTMQAMMPSLSDVERDYSNHHVCDDF